MNKQSNTPITHVNQTASSCCSSSSCCGPAKQVYRDEPKIGRNDLCPCDSGQKYKKCCGN